ncbi:hypothetical protein IW140_006386 [Coemansia sp. RSA 1813]|nr:hypothetical protein EV178_006362 [Coemansia sp. RSA 1646]KAJ1765703.1 hypothetical protein LPJ74_006244 [Coemansia sp. RSA 1843]KAJ2562570.1 hypothetical protein IW140_006386 [Coemansia sp. RSA 1813]
MIAGYAPVWKNITDIDPSKYTHINLAFGEPQPDGTIVFDTSFSVSEFVGRLQKAGTRAILGLGGWSGSAHFSDILKDAAIRNKFIDEIASLVKTNHMDGVDIDWITSNPCNTRNPQSDSANLLVLLRDLRSRFNSEFPQETKSIALGVGMKPPVVGEQDNDASEYANLVDYITVLAYDVNGSQSSTTGPNAPLNYELGRGAQYSLISAIDNWTSAKFPAEKILAGLAFYGRSLTAKSDMSKDSWNLYQLHEGVVPRGDDDDGLWADRHCADRKPSYSGVWSYRNMRSQKQNILQNSDVPVLPWKRYWDSISLTPWVFDTDTKTFVSYDDPASIKAKTEYAKERGLGGVSVYDITMDYNDELLNSVHNVIKPGGGGLQPVATSTWPSSSIQASPTPSSSTFAESQTSTTISSFESSSQLPLPSPSGSFSGGENEAMPHAGDWCNNKPSYKCLAEDGKGPNFILCAAGAWVQQQCGSGTACVQNGDYIYCDWPR